MESLAHLSEDVIARIVDFAPSSLFFLWQCGNRNLQSKILRSCRRFEIVDPSGTLSLLQWPTLLAQLPRLEYVYIKVKAVWESLNSIATHIKSLPNTLLGLELNFKGSSLLLVDDPHLETFRIDLKRPNLTKAPLWDIKSYFPALRVLDLSMEYRTIAVDADSFSVLPESLTKLRWSTHFISEDMTYEGLPRGLLELHTSSIAPSLTLPQLRSLPPNLKRLYGTNIHKEYLEALPRSLEEGPFSFKLGSTAPKFPSTLKRFSLAYTTVHIPLAHWTSLLPTRLERLSTVTCFLRELPLLPQTISCIKELTILGLDSVLQPPPRTTLEDGSWPPHLTDLEFHYGSHFSSARQLAILPRTLVALRNCVTDASIWEACADLPRSLTHLEVRRPPIIMSDLLPGKMDVDMLPPGLTFLRVEFALPSNAFSLLPRGLRTLSLPQNDLAGESSLPQNDLAGESTAHHLESLPPSLRCFIIRRLEVSLFPHLPRGLVELRFTFSSDHEVDFSALPPRLRILELKANRGHHWGNSFSTLPRTLMALYPQIATIGADQVQYLRDHVHLDHYSLYSGSNDVEKLKKLSPRWKAHISERLGLSLD